MEESKLKGFNDELNELLKKHQVTLKIEHRIVVVPVEVVQDVKEEQKDAKWEQRRIQNLPDTLK